jgi:hypothetical protein
MTTSLNELALAAVEATAKADYFRQEMVFNDSRAFWFRVEHDAWEAYRKAATPERILQYRNEVLEEAWQAVSTCLPDLPTSQQQELMAYFAYAIEALKTKEPA